MAFFIRISASAINNFVIKAMRKIYSTHILRKWRDKCSYFHILARKVLYDAIKADDKFCNRRLLLNSSDRKMTKKEAHR